MSGYDDGRNIHIFSFFGLKYSVYRQRCTLQRCNVVWEHLSLM